MKVITRGYNRLFIKYNADIKMADDSSIHLYLETTVKELLEAGKLSRHTYNCLHYAGLQTMKDVLAYGDSTTSLFSLRNFGRKAYHEILPFFNEIQLKYGILVSDSEKGLWTLEQEPMEQGSMGQEKMGDLLNEAYIDLEAADPKVQTVFMKKYRSAEQLHIVVVDGVRMMLEPQPELSMEENIAYRRMFVGYMQEAIHRMEDTHKTDNNVYALYTNRLHELTPQIEKFSNDTIARHFISTHARLLLGMIYDDMVSRQKMRTMNFLFKMVPTFDLLVPYFDKPLAQYRKLCPNQIMKRTLTDIFEMTKELKAEFDR